MNKIYVCYHLTWLTNWLPSTPSDWFTDQLIDWPINRVASLLTGCLTNLTKNRLLVEQNDKPNDWLNNQQTSWLTDGLTDLEV